MDCPGRDCHDPDPSRRPAIVRELNALQLRMGVQRPVARLVGWKGWVAPSGDGIDRVLADNKSSVKDWLRTRGLPPGYPMGAGD